MRYYIGISAEGPTVFRNVRKDDTGEPLLLIDESASKTLRVNFADWLESPETITAVTTTTSSCTCTATLSTPNVDLAISAVTSGYYGNVLLLATSSTGEVYRLTIRVRRTGRYMDEQRYRHDYA